MDDVIAVAHRARDDVFFSFWIPQVLSFDALSALTTISRGVKGVDFGTAVVSSYR